MGEYYSLEKLLVRLSGDDDDDDDDDDPRPLLTPMMFISITLLSLGWVFFWLRMLSATIECVQSPEEVAARREHKEREIERRVELNKLLPQSARYPLAEILRNY